MEHIFIDGEKWKVGDTVKIKSIDASFQWFDGYPNLRDDFVGSTFRISEIHEDCCRTEEADNPFDWYYDDLVLVNKNQPDIPT